MPALEVKNDFQVTGAIYNTGLSPNQAVFTDSSSPPKLISGAVSGGATGANPTGFVGLTAVNGVASTFLRSDGAPPLRQDIAPIWTNDHTWQQWQADAAYR